MCQQTVLFWFFSALKSERDILKVFKVITKITLLVLKENSKMLYPNLTKKKLINELSESRIQWMFNPAKSPWLGGAMEALVKISKVCLKAVVKD